MVEILKRWATVIRAHNKRLATALVGQFLYKIYNNVVDFVLLPFLMLRYGAVQGAFVYMGITLVADFLSVVLYDKVKRDVLGYEMVKELGGFLVGKKFLKWFHTFLKWIKKNYETNLTAKILFILLLSLNFNPFQIVVFMRPANEYRQNLKIQPRGKGALAMVRWLLLKLLGMMHAEDWFIFGVSYLGGNLSWVFVMGGVVEIVLRPYLDYLQPHIEPFLPFIY